MYIIRKIFGFFIFYWKNDYDYIVTDEFLIDNLRNIEKEKSNIEGEVYKNSFDVVFISNFALSFPTKLPFISVKGKLIRKGGTPKLRLSVNMISFVRFFYFFSALIILGFYFADKYYDSAFGHISDSRLPLFAPIFIYIGLMLAFIIESVACNNYFNGLTNSLTE
jgi:hypothetical protein